MAAAKLLGSRSHVVPGKIRISELFFEVPTDYSNPSRGSLRIFARSATKHESPIVPLSEEQIRKQEQKPWLVYLQGGPGFGCAPPQSMDLTKFALDHGYQMLYLDQRGTGLSTTITTATLALQGDARKQAEYLKLFRADNIVRDCEAIRETLTTGYPPELKKWSIFGQSFGGFCAFTYLSKYPQGLREAFTTGGVPPVGKTVDEIYSHTYETVSRRNALYYEKFPEDQGRVHNIVSFIRSQGSILLPSGGKLTVQRFLTIGQLFGFHGGMDTLHDIVLRLASDLSQFKFFTRPTLAEFEGLSSFNEAVIYSLLHEPCYLEGVASKWSADRVGRSLKQFQWLADEAKIDDNEPIYFSGEMIYPFMFETYNELQPLKEVAEILANEKEWPSLYDEAQLAKNEVPVYASSYVDDMYVDIRLVQETVGKTKGVKQFITNAMYHDALRSKVDEVLKQLFALREDVID